MNNPEKKPTVAHISVPYLRNTETFIYDRIAHPQRFNSLVVTNEPVINASLFPHPEIHTLASRSFLYRKFDAAARRLNGFSPYYFSVLKKTGAAVIHAHFGPVGCSLFHIKAKINLPLMTSFYGQDASALLHRKHYREAYRKLFEQCEIVSVLSEDMKKSLSDAGCPQEKIRIHHLAVDMETIAMREREPDSSDEIRILFAGRMVEKKGVEYLLRAFSLVRNMGINARLILAGEGPLQHRIEQTANELNVKNHVEIMGMRTRDEVLRLMRGAHIFTLFSVTAGDGDREGTPTVIIEAGAVGLPVVSTLHAGIPEMVDDGRSGFLVAERDVESFAEKLARLCADSALRCTMGQEGRKKMEREFSLTSVVRQIESDYFEMMEKR
ncbi:MAG: glycosyltransferase [bacterium]